MERESTAQEAATDESLDAPEIPSTSTPTRNLARDNEEDVAVEMRKVTISMPEWMHADLRRRARKRGITVTELMRRAVALDRILSEDPQAQILLQKGNEIQKVVVAE